MSINLCLKTFVVFLLGFYLALFSAVFRKIKMNASEHSNLNYCNYRQKNYVSFRTNTSFSHLQKVDQHDIKSSFLCPCSHFHSLLQQKSPLQWILGTNFFTIHVKFCYLFTVHVKLCREVNWFSFMFILALGESPSEQSYFWSGSITCREESFASYSSFVSFVSLQCWSWLSACSTFACWNVSQTHLVSDVQYFTSVINQTFCWQNTLSASSRPSISSRENFWVNSTCRDF